MNLLTPLRLEDLSRILRGAAMVASRMAQDSKALPATQAGLDNYRKSFESALDALYRTQKSSAPVPPSPTNSPASTKPSSPPAPSPSAPTAAPAQAFAASSTQIPNREAVRMAASPPPTPSLDELSVAHSLRTSSAPTPTAAASAAAADSTAAADSIAAATASSTDFKKSAEAAVTAESMRPQLRERKVPSTPLQRVMGFGGLAAGLALGTLQESAKRALGMSAPPPKTEAGGKAYSAVLSEANAERIAEALCRMRGAALKIGQMLSIQDENVIPPQVQAALERVRQGADVMPQFQLEAQMKKELGADWQRRLKEFDFQPMAAASIGQVHRARLLDGREVAMKVQYPGVAESIESDVDNLLRLMKYMNVFPKGMYLESAAKVGKKELALECDYEYELRSQQRFKALVDADPTLKGPFRVPAPVPELSSKRILTSELVPGVPIDKVSLMDQSLRDEVGAKLLRLTLKELFDWRFMQTDPNWGNFLYDVDEKVMYLIDFGASREFPKPFVDDYLKMVKACAERNRGEVINRSLRLGFLTGEENQVMLDAHSEAGFVVGMPFSTPGRYDFGLHSAMTGRVTELGATMLRHRLTAPPEEAYSLHRKLSGAFLACIKLRAKVPCRDMFYRVYNNHNWGPE